MKFSNIFVGFCKVAFEKPFWLIYILIFVFCLFSNYHSDLWIKCEIVVCVHCTKVFHFVIKWEWLRIPSWNYRRSSEILPNRFASVVFDSFRINWLNTEIDFSVCSKDLEKQLASSSVLSSFLELWKWPGTLGHSNHLKILGTSDLEYKFGAFQFLESSFIKLL